MRTTSAKHNVRFGLLKNILWGCLILTFQLVAMPSELSAGLCPGDPNDEDYLEKVIPCLNEKLQYVSMDEENAILKITGASVQILPVDGNGNSGTGNLSVGEGNNFDDSTAGFVSGYNNTIRGVGTTISGGNSNVAVGRYVTISGGYENGEQEGALLDRAGNEYYLGDESRSASATGGGYKNVSVGNYDVVVGGTDNKSLSLDHSTILGGEGNIIGGEKDLEGTGTTIIGGHTNHTENDYSVIVGGHTTGATGYASINAGGITSLSEGDYATGIGNDNGSAVSEHSLAAGVQFNSKANRKFATNIVSDHAPGYTAVVGEYSTICGGHHSFPSGDHATVHGGWSVPAEGSYSSSTGGHLGGAGSLTDHLYAFVGGNGDGEELLKWFPSLD